MNMNISIESKSLNIFYKFIKIPKYIFKCIDNKVEDLKKKRWAKGGIAINWNQLVEWEWIVEVCWLLERRPETALTSEQTSKLILYQPANICTLKSYQREKKVMIDCYFLNEWYEWGFSFCLHWNGLFINGEELITDPTDSALKCTLSAVIPLMSSLCAFPAFSLMPDFLKWSPLDLKCFISKIARNIFLYIALKILNIIFNINI